MNDLEQVPIEVHLEAELALDENRAAHKFRPSDLGYLMVAASSLLRRGARLLVPVARKPSSPPLPIPQPRDPRAAGLFTQKERRMNVECSSFALKEEFAHRCSASTSRSRPFEPIPGGWSRAKGTPCSSPSDCPIGCSWSPVSR